MQEKRLFLVIGTDFINRKRAVDSIKIRLLKKKDSFLNTHVYYSKDIDLNNLKDIVFSFSFTGSRVIILKGAQDLSREVKDFIYNNIKSIVANNYLIFELEKDSTALKNDRQFAKDKFFSYLMTRAYLFKISSFEEDVSIRRLMGMVRRNRLPESLYALERIFEKGGKGRDFLGIQILGALNREFSYFRNPLKKRKYFNLIWETERALKEGKVDQKIALQLLITKLLLS